VKEERRLAGEASIEFFLVGGEETFFPEPTCGSQCAPAAPVNVGPQAAAERLR
jgi:hypothetical protein